MLKTSNTDTSALDTNNKETQRDALRQTELDDLIWWPYAFGGLNVIECTPEPSVVIIDENGALSDYKGPWARRTPMSQNPLTDPERQKRVLAEVEPNMPVFIHRGKVVLPLFSKAAGWQSATKKQIAEKCLDIYKKTGRLLLDAANTGNILSRGEDLVCVDVDMAVRPSSPLSVEGFFSCSSEASRQREHEFWYKVIKRYHLLAPAIKKTMKVTLVEQVLLSLIELIDHFGESRVPEEYLTAPFLKYFYIARHSYDITKAIESAESRLQLTLRDTDGVIPSAS